MAIIQTEKRSRRWIRRCGILLIVGIAIVLFWKWFDRTYRIDRDKDVTVTVIGLNERYTTEEIKDHVLSHWFDRYSVLIRWYYKYRKIETLPFLQKIDIAVDEDNKVTITVYEKPPIACIYDMGFYLYFNRDGELIASRSENSESLPVVTGLEYRNLTMYQPIETKKTELFPIVLNLVFQMKKNDLNIDEIHFEKDYSVTLYMNENAYFLGNREVYDIQISMIASVNEELQKRNRDTGREAHYDVNMSSVFEPNDKFYAKEREELQDNPEQEKQNEENAE